MEANRKNVISTLAALVLVASALNVGLALTRSEPDALDTLPGAAGAPYEVAALEGPGGAALSAAVAAIPHALSYDFRDLAASLDAATTRMTGTYAVEFTENFNLARPIVTQREQVTDALVRGAGLVRTTGETRALCLIYVDRRLLQSSRLDAADRPVVLSRLAVLVDLVRRSGAWKVDGLRPV